MKKMVFLLLTCLLALSLFGCNGNSSALVGSTSESGDSREPTPATTTEESTDTTAETEPPAEEPPTDAPAETAPITEVAPPDYTRAYVEYLAIFRDRQWDIAKYGWSSGDGQVAICDIVGDATPELLFITSYDNFEADLSVYQYNTDDTPRIYFEMVDIQAGSGIFYCLFTTTDDKLILYKRGAGEERTYSYEELALNAEGKLTTVSSFVHVRTPSADHTTFSHQYAQDGAAISESKFATLESELVGSMKDVVIWSCSEIDGIVLEKISKIGTSCAMPAEVAIEFLIDKAGVAGVSSPANLPNASSEEFTLEAAISHLTTPIMNGWGQYVTEAEIPDKVDFVAVVSDRLYDSQPIYLIGYTIGDVGRSKSLVFADGTTMSQHHENFADYSGYFDTIDIAAEWPFS